MMRFRRYGLPHVTDFYGGQKFYATSYQVIPQKGVTIIAYSKGKLLASSGLYLKAMVLLWWKQCYIVNKTANLLQSRIRYSITWFKEHSFSFLR
jgi:hypothetical protein